MENVNYPLSKLRILMLQSLGCTVFGIILGTAFWWFDGGKTSKTLSDVHTVGGGGQGGMGSTVYHFRPAHQVKVYPGVWHKDYLEIVGK